MIKFKIKYAMNSQYYVLIIAKNGRILFTSETYKRKRNAIKAIHAVNPNAVIIDES